MGYGRLRLGSSESLPSISESLPSQTGSTRRKRRFILLGLLAVLLLVASGVSVGLLVRSWARSGSGPNRTPTQAISQTCALTRYPELCVSSLLDFPGALDAGERDLVHISLNMTVQRIGKALYGASAIAGVSMDSSARSAYDDCMELLDQLSQSLAVIAPAGFLPAGASDKDVLTWLSAALSSRRCMRFG